MNAMGARVSTPGALFNPEGCPQNGKVGVELGGYLFKISHSLKEITY